MDVEVYITTRGNKIDALTSKHVTAVKSSYLMSQIRYVCGREVLKGVRQGMAVN